VWSRAPAAAEQRRPRHDYSQSRRPVDEALNAADLAEAERRLGPILIASTSSCSIKHRVASSLQSTVVVSAAAPSGRNGHAAFMNYASPSISCSIARCREPAVNVIHVLGSGGALSNMIFGLESYVHEDLAHGRRVR